jgi:AraC-like DNA-binding protein
MSRALSVYHGRFGRATLYELNRPMTTHAHREGHLTFYVGGGEACVSVLGKPNALTARSGVAINPWEPHAFTPSNRLSGGVYLVLYIDRSWFQNMSRDGHLPLQFGRSQIEMTPAISAAVEEAVRLLENYDTVENFDGTLFELTDACFDQSWRLAGGWQRYCGPASSFIDFRVRKSIVLMSEKLGSEIELDEVARDAGLSRPHFYKLFRRQTGVTPNVYLNTLRMEKAVQRLGQTAQSITEIGYELGFSCQSVFTRFFSSHVGMAPTDYRRAVQVLHG